MSQQKKNKKDKDRLFLSKVIIVGLLLVLQIGIIVYGMISLGKYFAYVQALCTILSLVVVIYIINKPDNPAYKLAWVVPILLFPIFGGVFYVAIAGNHASKHFVRKIEKSITDACRFLKQDEEVAEHLDSVSEIAGMQSKYIRDWGKYPVFQNTEVTYYPFGEDNFEPLLEELKKAKRYIFMEYFIIREGLFWNSVLEILEQKVKEGVDVRVMFDDMGCVATIPSGYEKRLREKGIRCYSFNRFIPILTLRLNNRDHRKITVIDGHTGFTGGINLSDEYINETSPYGRWKDTGIMLKGDAVWSLTVMFLQMWRCVSGDVEDFETFRPVDGEEMHRTSDGYVQPYSDSPLDQEILGENIYLNMINRAKKRIYIITPYLILDNEMVTALTLAAKSGVDVRIIIPGIPDKKIVYVLSQSNCVPLLKDGVRVYRYMPGFTHAKVVLVDDQIATVGTVNFDYRSLFLHFECGVWMYRSNAVQEIRKDFEETFTDCEEMQYEECIKISGFRKMVRAVLNMLGPLL
mgnify:FL=1